MVVLVASACARGEPAHTYPTGPDDLVIRIDRVGGFQPIQALLFEPSILAVFGDGTVVRQSARPEIYPGPALAGFESIRLSEQGLRSVVARAVDAGLAGGDKELPDGRIADAATTVFTTTIDGQTSVVRAHALGEGDSSIERVRANRFVVLLEGLENWLPPEDIVSTGDFEPKRLQIVSQPEAVSGQEAPEELQIGEVAWPLPTPLSSFGQPFSGLDGSRCGEVNNEELGPFLTALSEANAITRWVSEGTKYLLFPRILLGDQEACVSQSS